MKEKIEKLKSEKLISKSDIAIVAITCVAALFLLFFYSFSYSENAEYNIYIENELYKTGSLSQDDVFTIEATTGEMTFQIENGAISVLESSCADHICESQGEICYNNSKIICLPNKIVVEIVGGEDSQIDAVS